MLVQWQLVWDGYSNSRVDRAVVERVPFKVSSPGKFPLHKLNIAWHPSPTTYMELWIRNKNTTTPTATFLFLTWLYESHIRPKIPPPKPAF